MKRELEPYQLIERSIIKKYRKELWTPFIAPSSAMSLSRQMIRSPSASRAARTPC